MRKIQARLRREIKKKEQEEANKKYREEQEKLDKEKLNSKYQTEIDQCEALIKDLEKLKPKEK